LPAGDGSPNRHRADKDERQKASAQRDRDDRIDPRSSGGAPVLRVSSSAAGTLSMMTSGSPRLSYNDARSP
jgi:hypothetical protein